ncbi:MAG: hypothetical protein PQJ46_03970 [Spirochaetales bacterium]|nr:hypothetical protein [Spirochaetales bacterium]
MKIRRVLPLAIIVLLICSCTSVKVPGTNSEVTTVLAEVNYKVLGDVSIEGVRRNLFGIFEWGGATYFDLMEKAKKEYGADDVINISLDYKNSVFLGLYSSRKYYVRGLAIKYER